jgi:hypothetical protein
MPDEANFSRTMNVLRRAKAIVLDPRAEWPRIESESGDVVSLLVQYVAVLALVPAIAGFIGTAIVGVVYPAVGTLRAPILIALFSAILGYVASFVVVLLLAVIVDTLARRLGGRRNFVNALKLAVYCYTPAWLAGIFLLVPGLRFLTLLGLYSAYLAWTGFSPLMKTPPERTLICTAVVVACAWAFAVLAAMAQQMLFAGPGGI